MRTARSLVAGATLGVLGLMLALVAPALACAPSREHASGALLMRAIVAFYVTPVAGNSTPPPNPGYRLVAADGGVFAFGSAGYHGSTGGMALHEPIVGMAPSSSGGGYWLVGSDGGIFAFGDAGFLGSMGGRPLSAPIVGMSRTYSGDGYWLVAKDGGIFSFGDAPFLGSTGGRPLAAPIVGMSRSLSGQGYVLAGADGGVFAFGDSPFHGSAGGQRLGRPMVGIAASQTSAYWLVDSGGGVRNFGDAWPAVAEPPVPPFGPVVGIVSSGTSIRHWLAGADGRVYARRGAPFLGSAAGAPLARPIVGITANPG